MVLCSPFDSVLIPLKTLFSTIYCERSLKFFRLFWLFTNPFSFSLNETIKINKQKNPKRNWLTVDIIPRLDSKYLNNIIKIVHLKKTLYLKTAIMEKE